MVDRLELEGLSEEYKTQKGPNMDIMKNCKIILCPTLTLAKQEAEKYKLFATCEAEYGKEVVEGSPEMGAWATLAHHDTRSDNPPPCIWNTTGHGNVSPVVPDAILVSHLDLDCLGGIGLILGYYNEDEQMFWKAAAHIDIAGPHRILEVPEETHSKLRAFWGWNEYHRPPRFSRDSVTDVTQIVAEYFEVLDRIAKNDPEILKIGETWYSKTEENMANSLVYESNNIRGFSGPHFTAAAYTGNDGVVRPCTVSYSSKKKAVTLAFENGGKDYSAVKILQELYGPEAGGHAGIAGTPRGGKYDVFDLVRVIKHVEGLLNK